MRWERWAGIALAIVVWYVVGLSGVIKPLFIALPHTVSIKLMLMLFSGEVWLDILATLAKVLASFALSAVIGIVLGMLMGYYEKIHAALEFPVDFLRSLPALTLFPLLMAFFGIGEKSKIATAVFTCTLIIIINTYYGVIGSNRYRQLTAQLLGADTKEIFSKVVVMDALPQIIAGLRTSLSMALIVITVTEMFLGTRYGIGHRIYNLQQNYRTAELFAALIIAGCIGFGLNKLFRVFEHRFVHWNNG